MPALGDLQPERRTGMSSLRQAVQLGGNARTSDHSHQAEPVSVTTTDGVHLRGLHIAGSRPGPAFVIGHGFTNSTATGSTRTVLDRFAQFGSVVALDFRGHGRSAGLASVGRDEVLDLDAAVLFARTHCYAPITSVGFSMGAAIALRHAGIGDQRPDRVVAISSPSRWYIRDTRPMRRVQALLEHPLGPLFGRLIGVRLGPAWTDIPLSPIEAVDKIAPIPLLLVHGTDDRYFSPAHVLSLRAASADHAQMWIEAGMGHAESATSAELISRIAAWTR